MENIYYSDQEEEKNDFKAESDEDEKLFNKFQITNKKISSDESEIETEKDKEKTKISKLFMKKLLNPEDEIDKFAFKDNDDLEKLLEKKVKEKEREKERIENENKKKTKRLMKNAIEYINFLKVYIICSLYNQIKLAKTTFSIKMQAYVISKLSIKDILELDKIKANYKNRVRNMDLLVRNLFKLHNNNFTFKKFNSFYLLHNFAFTGNYSHQQIIFIFIALCEYCEIPVRYVNIMDLKSLNVNILF